MTKFLEANKTKIRYCFGWSRSVADSKKSKSKPKTILFDSSQSSLPAFPRADPSAARRFFCSSPQSKSLKQAKTLDKKVQNVESENRKHHDEVYQFTTGYKETIDEGEPGQLSNNLFFLLYGHNKEDESSTTHHLPARPRLPIKQTETPRRKATIGNPKLQFLLMKAENHLFLYQSKLPRDRRRLSQVWDYTTNGSNGKFIDSNKFDSFKIRLRTSFLTRQLLLQLKP